MRYRISTTYCCGNMPKTERERCRAILRMNMTDRYDHLIFDLYTLCIKYADSRLCNILSRLSRSRFNNSKSTCIAPPRTAHYISSILVLRHRQAPHRAFSNHPTANLQHPFISQSTIQIYISLPLLHSGATPQKYQTRNIHFPTTHSIINDTANILQNIFE